MALRVSSDALFRQSTAAMQAQTARLAEVQQQISSGRRFTHAHEAPAAASRVLQWEAAQARLEAQTDAADRVQHRLGLSELALDDGQALLDRARELLLSGGNGALGPQDREGLARELEALAGDWQQLVNRRDGSGQPLFAGTGLGPAFAADGQYLGSPAARLVEIADGQTLADGLPGERLFGEVEGQSSFDWWQAAADALREPDAGLRAAALGTALSGNDALAERLGQGRSELGIRLQALDRAASWRATAGLELSEGLSRLRDTDLIESATRLTQASTQLSAAQSAYLQIARLSLFERLR